MLVRAFRALPGRATPTAKCVTAPINRCPDRPKGCLKTGKRCFTNRGGSLVCDVCYHRDT